MTTAMAMPGNTANAVLVHFFGGGGLADERYVVEGLRTGGRSSKPCFSSPTLSLRLG